MKNSRFATIQILFSGLLLLSAIGRDNLWAAPATLSTCGGAPLRVIMQNVPESEAAYIPNQRAMFDLYNAYMNFFGEISSDGYVGWLNMENELAGFVSDESMYASTGMHWGDSLGRTIAWTYAPPCGPSVEVDVAFNPGYLWTYDKQYAEEHPTHIYYDAVLIHELGHVVGLMHPADNYNFTAPTIMHAYVGQTVLDNRMIHAPDARLLRLHNAVRQNLSGPPKISMIKPLTNMAVTARYTNSSGGLANSYVSKSYRNDFTFFSGEPVVVNNLTVENTGTSDVDPARLSLYLSPERFNTGASTYKLGEWTWSNFSAETQGEFNFFGTVPPEAVSGEYFVVAQVDVDDTSIPGDSLGFDDTAYLWGKVTVDARSVAITRPLSTPEDVYPTWRIGATSQIQWSSHLAGSSVTVKLSRDQGNTWETVAGNVPNSGFYNWTVSGPQSTTCKVKIFSQQYAFVTDESDLFVIAPALPPARITVTSPNGGEGLLEGQHQVISWNSAGFDKSAGGVKVEVGCTGGAAETLVWKTLKANQAMTTEAGFFDWLVDSSPCWGTTANPYKGYVRVTSVDQPAISDSSDNFFAVSIPRLEITSLSAGATYYDGDLIQISWTGSSVGPVTIKFLNVEQGGSASIGTVPDTGSYNWYNDGRFADATYQVSLWSGSFPLAGSDLITLAGQRSINITSPQFSKAGNPVWKIGSTYDIKWVSSGAGSYVQLFYSFDQGATHLKGITPPAGAPNTGSYSWRIPADTAPSETVKIWVKAPEGLVQDWSDQFAMRPEITLAEPRGGERWYLGASAPVSWVSAGTAGLVRIDQSRNNGQTWETLIAATADNGLYSPRHVAGPVSTACLIRISYVDLPAVSSTSPRTFSIIDPAITVVSPQKDEVWYVGEKKAVEWNSDSLADGKVMIELSRDGGGWTPLVDPAGIINDGYEEIPVVWAPSYRYSRIRVRHIELGIIGTSDVFSTELPSLQLTSPNGGETFYLGEKVQIAWVGTKDKSLVKIEISPDKGLHWEPLFEAVANNGFIPWTSRGTTADPWLMRISNVAVPTVYDVSDDTFSIVQNPLAVDNDHDGQTENEGDCNDVDAKVYKGAPELCDGKDNDCDGVIDETYNTGELCGLGVCANGLLMCKDVGDGTFCSTAALSSREMCNGADDDCDGLIDEEVVCIAPVTDLAVQEKKYGLNVSWTPVGAAGYHVYRNANENVLSFVAETPAGKPYYADSSLTAGVVYCYMVRAVDTRGVESESSNTACATAAGKTSLRFLDLLLSD